MAAWLFLALAAALFLAGIVGQVFGLGTRKGHPEDRRAGLMVLRIVSVIAGLWLVIFSVSHAAHLQFTGKW